MFVARNIHEDKALVNLIKKFHLRGHFFFKLGGISPFNRINIVLISVKFYGLGPTNLIGVDFLK